MIFSLSPIVPIIIIMSRYSEAYFPNYGLIEVPYSEINF